MKDFNIKAVAFGFAVVVATSSFVALERNVCAQDNASAPTKSESLDGWLARQLERYSEPDATQQDESDSSDPFADITTDSSGASKTSASAKSPAKSSPLPEDQERDLANRREVIRLTFTANELRRARRKAEEDLFYKREQERLAGAKSKDHVPTANFGHVYDTSSSFRGGTLRKERIESGMTVGEFYGGNWKHASVDAALQAASIGRYPHRTNNAQYFYQAVLARSLSGTSSRLPRRRPPHIPYY